MTVQWNHFSLSRYDTSQLSITILDVNDNAPLFRDSPYEIKVVENDEEGLDEIVFKAEAQDPDGRPFNRVEYALRDDYDGKEQPIRNIWFQKKKYTSLFFCYVSLHWYIECGGPVCLVQLRIIVYCHTDYSPYILYGL